MQILKNMALVLSLMSAVLFSNFSSAQSVLDQEQSAFTGNIVVGISPGVDNSHFQTLTAGLTGDMDIVGVYLSLPGGSTGPVEAFINVYDGDLSVSANLVAVEPIGVGNGWHNVVLSNPVPVIAGNKYTIQVQANVGDFFFHGSFDDKYPQGIPSLPITGWDFAFRTFVDVSSGTSGPDDDWSGAGTGKMYPSNITDHIGIQTTNPEGPLHVVETGPGSTIIAESSGSAGTRANLLFRNNGTNAANIRTTATNRGMQFQVFPTATTNAEAITVEGLTYGGTALARVGILTSSPLGSLHVVEKQPGSTLILDSESAGGYPNILYKQDGQNLANVVALNTRDLRFQVYQNNTTPKTGLFIKGGVANPLVAIGTEAPPTNMMTTDNNPYLFFVKGGGLFEEVKVSTDAADWADYVFKTNYKLLSLEEVPQHIEENGFLHNTPSAQEIESNGGIELGAITINQQEKIEELFLHVIQLNENVKTLQQENTVLQQQLDGLSK